MIFKRFTQKVTKWGLDRGIIKHSPIDAQLIKLNEEFGELWDAYRKNDDEKILDAVGDVSVVAVILSKIIHYQRDDEKLDMVTFYPHTRIFKHNDALTNLFYAEIYKSRLNEYFLNQRISKSEIEYNKLPLETIEEWLGDMVSYLNEFCDCIGLDYNDALSKAWNEIKDRKGYLREDGIFVKEGDK
jgi:NTP pyrophosphatase (non-canonical NTP hydrolase)